MTPGLPDLCDAHPGLVSIVEGGFRHFGGRRAFSGPVRTIRCFEDNSLVAERVREPGEGRVLVIDGGGSRRCALVGDRLALAALENGWSGLLVYGCVRDIDEIQAMALGIMALDVHPMRSTKRGEGERDVPVRFGGVTFVPDQYLYADANGVLISPQALT